MKTILTLALASFSLQAFAQKEVFDLITYTPPKGWVKETKSSVISYTVVDNKDKAWCQIGIFKSTVSKGSIESDFESEWSALAAKQYTITEAPQTSAVEEADGWKIKAGSAKFLFNKQDAAVMLTTFSGHGVCISIIATTGNQRYLTDIETFISSIDLKKPDALAGQAPPINDKNSIVGIWGMGTGGQQKSDDYKNPAAANNYGYMKAQYTFNNDGSYHFVSKTFRMVVTEILLVKETGTYQVSEGTITILPQKSIIEAWSKKGGTDKWGKLISSQNRSLEKITYRFTKHYFSGIQQWNLVLQADKVTQRDGPFSNNTTFSNAWYYAPISDNNTAIDLPGAQILAAKEKEPLPPASVSAPGKFTFTTTNFDNGWTSTVQEDWVLVTKANTSVLIHYPNKKADAYNSVLMDGLKNAWELLVAPKYSTVSNLEFKPISSWQSIEFAEADAIEKVTRKTVHVVLFKMNYSGGNGRYMEFITADKKSFEEQFGAYHPDSYGWEKMESMANYNKFAVAEADIKGTWTSDFSGVTQYVNANTGLDAGMDTHASNEAFEFTAGNTYHWSIGVASGQVGNIKFQSAKSTGKFSMKDNWHIYFSDIEGKPRTYDAWFSCIKGLRILWINNTAYAKKD